MSMTGFGKATAESKTHRISAEIKSLNSKQLDLNVRLPYIFREGELEARAIVGHAIERGKADLLVTCEVLPGADASVSSELNVDVMRRYKLQIEETAALLGLPVPDDMFRVLMNMPDAMHTSAPEAAEGEIEVLYDVIRKAVEGLLAHRRTEGRELEKFFRVRIDAIRELLASIEQYENERVPKIRQRLEDALAKIPAVEVDKGRLRTGNDFLYRETRRKRGKAAPGQAPLLFHRDNGCAHTWTRQEVGLHIAGNGTRNKHSRFQEQPCRNASHSGENERPARTNQRASTQRDVISHHTNPNTDYQRNSSSPTIIVAAQCSLLKDMSCLFE